MKKTICILYIYTIYTCINRLCFAFKSQFWTSIAVSSKFTHHHYLYTIHVFPQNLKTFWKKAYNIHTFPLQQPKNVQPSGQSSSYIFSLAPGLKSSKPHTSIGLQDHLVWSGYQIYHVRVLPRLLFQVIFICTTLQGTNISELGKRKIIFKSASRGGYVSLEEGIFPLTEVIAPRGLWVFRKLGKKGTNWQRSKRETHRPLKQMKQWK